MNYPTVSLIKTKANHVQIVDFFSNFTEPPEFYQFIPLPVCVRAVIHSQYTQYFT